MSDEVRYAEAVEAIKAAILHGQYMAARHSNSVLLELYFAVGGYVSANTRNKNWGQGAIAAISHSLQVEIPGLRGFSERNLKYMRTFHEEWSPYLVPEARARPMLQASGAGHEEVPIRHLQVPNCEPGVQEAFFSIGFTHHRALLEKVKGLEERLFYVGLCAGEHLSVDGLKASIRKDEYHHRGALPNNFLATIPESQRALRAISAFKDEYLLDFINVEELGVRDEGDVDERVMEQGIVKSVRDFMMEFGRGFSFIANSYHLDAFGDDQFVDLLFFNRILNCLVAVELKRGKFKPAYLGQLSAHLVLLDEFERQPHENPAVGIVLCKDMNEAFVSLVIQSYSSPMGVATYSFEKDVPDDLRSALPDIDDLRALLEGES